MKVSYFETGRYTSARPMPSEWPVPPGAYDPEAGAQAYRTMIERVQCARHAKQLGLRLGRLL